MKPFFEIFKKWDELFSNSELKSPSADQIMQLEQQGNFSNNWSNVKFSKPDSTNLSVTVSRIRGCTFSGRTIIGCLAGDVEGPQGVQMFCGLTNSYFANDCIISDSCRIVDNILLKDVYVGTAAVILGCGTVVGRDPADAKGPFTYYAIELTLGPESDGRVVRAVAGMRYADICRQALGSQAQLEEKDAAAAPSRSSWFTVIGDGAKVVKCDEVVNCLIGCDSRIASSCLSNCVVLSVPGRRVLIESGARLSCCIINEACSLGMNCHAEDSFLCECSSLGDFARVCQSVLGPDSSVAGGECHHCLLGPFVGFHHHSLLIATVWPTGRGNIAYGAKVGANHTGRVNDQECWPGEGCFFGLGAIVKFPLNLYQSPYSIVTAGSTVSPQRIAFPFSLISVPDKALDSARYGPTTCTIKPGWMLYSNPYMIERSAKKFLSRRKAVGQRTDFPVLRPAIVDMVRSARSRLQSAVATGSELNSEREVSGLGLCVLAKADLARAIDAYSAFVRRYALHGLLYAVHQLLETKRSSEQQETADLADLWDTSVDVCAGDEINELDSIQLMSRDLASFDVNAPTTASTNAGPRNSGLQFLIPDCDCRDVLSHQLAVLKHEYPDVNIVDSLRDLTKNTADFTSSPLLSLLLELASIEGSLADRVASCRARDGDKGRQVIPDYDRVNPVATDVERDAVVRDTRRRAGDIAAYVDKLSTVREKL